jgi:acyl-CoA synthetase (AMP-forming)/AMP-acid ligase II
MTDQSTWNFGDILEAVDRVNSPDAPALIHADGDSAKVLLWSDLARRSNNLAAALVARGASPDDKIAIYTRNCTEYLQTLVAAFKARLVHVNVNFRYLDDELAYIIENSDARFVVFGSEFDDRVERLAERCPEVRSWIRIAGDADAAPAFSEPFDELAESGDGSPLGLERSSDDLLFIYTGGTTGMPKGVMWRAEDLWGALGHGINSPSNRGKRPSDVNEHAANLSAHLEAGGVSPKQLVACPLMHGTGLLTAITCLSSGGCVVTHAGASFDPVEMFETVDGHEVASVVIVGDAFARPMLKTLNENPGRWSLSSLRVIMSSGVMWSREVKQGLLEHVPNAMLADMFGSSEAVGFGTSITSKQGGNRTARFMIGDLCKVFTEDHREVEPGSGERGFVARTGPIPLGYYKDPEKTARTFPVIDGVRYSIPGDWCTVEADGTLTLLGRGSVCINTAGEKVYPEEVEEALKTHAAVEDALVVGLPDEKWGQAVTAIVEPAAGSEFDEDVLRAHVKTQLAAYKTPKRIVAVDTMFRAPNGKADYKSAAAHAARILGVD